MVAQLAQPFSSLNLVADRLITLLGPNTWLVMGNLVDDVFTVDKEQILQATCLVWERLKICVEPNHDVGAAVLLFHDKFWERYLDHIDHNNGNNPDKKRIVNAGVLLCGGNVDVVATMAKMRVLLSPT